MTHSRLLFPPTKAALTFLLLFSGCSAQQDTLDFQWHNPNPFTVTFDVFEVSPPPDTSVIISQLNTTPIPDDRTDCLWSTPFTFDDSTHYFRLRATRFDTLHSDLSHTASILTLRHPISPLRIIISTRYD